MTVSCPECKSVFRVDPAKVPATGVRARCSVCGGVIAIGAGTLPVSVTPTSSSAAVPPFAAAPSRAPSASTLPVAPTLPPSASLMTPPAPSAVSLATSHAASTPPVVPPVSPALGSLFGTPISSAAATTPAVGARLINPFLRADPAQRARRLARALVSDLVAYHPQKREDGLRDGTLRQLFREEIKKSYEEYVEQVGRDVAEQSPYFQDALNEILAGGRRLF